MTTDRHPATTDRHFGEEGGRLSYSSYLRLPQLLTAQLPEADPPAHDELLFITVHQVYELWFKLLLFELDDARDAMLSGDAYVARVRLQRVRVIEDVLISQLSVLETMTPQDFLAFRAHLAPASGFQSVQFRELEFLSGAKDPGYLDRLVDASADDQERLRSRLSEPSLWDGFLAVLEASGFSVTTREQRLTALRQIAQDRTAHGPVWDLAEALLEHDEQQARWRARHVLMVEREIGGKSGTGGSSGAPYLRSRLEMRFFPELWELRSRL